MAGHSDTEHRPRASMSTVTSRHTQSVHEAVELRGEQYPSLNVSALLTLLDKTYGAGASASKKAGKKRARSRSPDAPPAKRAKSADGVGHAEPVPTVSATASVYRHEFEIQCIDDGDDDDDIEFDEAAPLLKWLDAHVDASDAPQTFDLGAVYLCRQHGRVHATTHRLHESVHKGRASDAHLAADARILVVPPLSDDVDAAEHDFPPNDARDILAACVGLENMGTMATAARLQLVALPAGAPDVEAGELPFRVLLSVDISLLFHDDAKTPPAPAAAEALQRRVLSYFFRAPSSAASARHTETDIPFFYSALKPAPPLASPAADAGAQPEELVPTLLPFQRRSVAWLLAREGKMLDPADERVVPAAAGQDADAGPLPLFWEQVRLADDAVPRVYFNRLTGAATRVRPAARAVMGGMLAEEPGLGKTLEAIALVLLHPHPARTPAVRRWDEGARVDVREIKTSLIVTPASLAQQWVDEIALHAPSLRVLVYDGWAKVGVPITEEQAEEERQRRLDGKGKAKGKAKAGSRTSKASTSRAKGKKRASTPDSEADTAMDVDSVSDLTEPSEDADEDPVVDWCAHVNTFDVCVTTYNVLQQDLGVARAPLVRPRRAGAEYAHLARPRSPLVMCEWARVIMDEVQMVGGGKTEEMVSLIPRLSSFAVSGTPARAHVSDLIHVLKFLRVEPSLHSARLWQRLLKPGFAADFAALFQNYAIRTMKNSVKDELTIPPQTRYLVPIELGRVERHVYDENVQRALDELGLDARGVAATAGWEVDAAVLRTWLRRLRGITTHPQVGQLQNAGDRLHKPGVLKTMAEVLEGMKDLNWRNVLDDRKKKIEALVRLGQLSQHDDASPTRYRSALEFLVQAEKEVNSTIDEIKDVIAAHDLKGEVLKKEAAALRAARGQDAPAGAGARADGGVAASSAVDKGKEKAADSHSAENGAGSTSAADKGNGKAAEPSDNLDDDHESETFGDDAYDGLPKTPAGEAHIAKRRALQQRLREFNLALHKVKFLQGDVHHVLGAQNSTKEDEAYAEAEKLRRLLLRATELGAMRAMGRLQRDAAGPDLTKDDLLIKVPFFGQGGIRTSDMMDEANEIIEELLNSQSALLWEWRTRIFDLLTEPLTSGNDDANGQEYTKSLDTQGQAEALMQAYTALMADRREVLVAERTTLAAHDTKERQKRKTKAAIKAIAASVEAVEAVDLQPEDEALSLTLGEERKALMEGFNGKALKSVMVALSGVVAKIQNDNDPEKIIAKDASIELRRLLSSQASAMDKLDADLAQLRKAFNERILYFRQLQEISDSVIEAEWEGSLMLAMAITEEERTSMNGRINAGRARSRYLENLTKEQQEGKRDEEDELCILCRCEFTRGYITQCAHVFCETCTKAWIARKEGKVCPVCRVGIAPDQLQRFTVEGGPEQAPPKLISNNEVAPKSRRRIEYNFIDPKLFEDIQTVESHGSYGSKIQTLLRHLLHVQLTEPGAKSIVFSAWADSLLIIQHALVNNGIPCLRIDQSKGKENAAKRFRTDPGILVLLLHGERENAGLNVTCASRVFLVESVVNHAFEIQAIARVDRMGQRRETEVFCYYAEETIERNILDLAAKQGLSLYTKDNSAGTVSVTPFNDAEKQLGALPAKAKAKQKGDFIFSVDDMLAILFPSMFEDIEYLLPEDHGAAASRQPLMNAEAGPSRIAQ